MNDTKSSSVQWMLYWIGMELTMIAIAIINAERNETADAFIMIGSVVIAFLMTAELVKQYRSSSDS